MLCATHSGMQYQQLTGTAAHALPPFRSAGVWRRCCGASSRRELRSWWPGAADGNQCNMCAFQMACACCSAPMLQSLLPYVAAEAAAHQLAACLDKLLPCSCAGWLPMVPMPPPPRCPAALLRWHLNATLSPCCHPALYPQPQPAVHRAGGAEDVEPGHAALFWRLLWPAAG